jgi:hypothetical protein
MIINCKNLPHTQMGLVQFLITTQHWFLLLKSGSDLIGRHEDMLWICWCNIRGHATEICCFSHVLYVKILVKFNKRLANLVEFTLKKQKIDIYSQFLCQKRVTFGRKEKHCYRVYFHSPHCFVGVSKSGTPAPKDIQIFKTPLFFFFKLGANFFKSNRPRSLHLVSPWPQ